MGVPRFYRWLAKRYPAFRAPADAGHQPHVDNLYLDLNGIVHGCSGHEQRGAGAEALPDDVIALACFRQICAIVELVAPHSLVFLGLDGVAPRAKLNQQRARRFVSALEKPARERPEEPPGWFDSNCITPGTEFMGGLGDALAFLVQQKMNEDSRWATLEVLLSTTSVPGEGEHKIMEYIRRRTHPPDTVHCAYGADADLILLGLASHEPHFLVLREVPDYSSMRAVVGGPEARVERSCAPMEFMSIALLREYLRCDLCSPAAAPIFDIERAIDDFVLCTFLCGNDFLPHIPCVDIADGAMDAIVTLYRKLLPEWGGFLTDDGEIVMHRFEHFMTELAALEPLITGLKKQQRRIASSVIMKKVVKTANQMWGDAAPESPEDETSAAGEGPDAETMAASKRAYYEKKLQCQPGGAQHRKLCREFLRGMAWTLKYYVEGCPSWGWYYPFHYAPFLSDMRELSQHCIYEIGFELGQPYSPLQQLLAVLPPGSAWALPPPFRHLMLDPGSPIADFYPAEFAQDSNGKRNDWEATILLDFVDETRLGAAASAAATELTVLETARNEFSLPLRFAVDGLAADRDVDSPFPQLLPGIANSVVCCCPEEYEGSPRKYVCELRPGAQYAPPPKCSLPVMWHKSAKVSGSIHSPGLVYVFGETRSTPTSVIMQIDHPEPVEIDDSVLGTLVAVDFPWARLARCVGVLSKDRAIGEAKGLDFELEVKAMASRYRGERGIQLPSSPNAVLLVRVVVYAAPGQDGSVVHGLGQCVAYPLALCGPVDAADWRLRGPAAELSAGTTVLCTDRSRQSFGCPCLVTLNVADQSLLRVAYKRRPTGPVPVDAGAESWLDLAGLCDLCEITKKVADWLTQNVHFRLRGEDYDAGLHLRFFRRGLMRSGFVRRRNYNRRGAFLYSPAVVELLQAYKNAVPELFEVLAAVEAGTANAGKGTGSPGSPLKAAVVFGQDSVDTVMAKLRQFREPRMVTISKEPLHQDSASVLSGAIVQEVQRGLDAEAEQSASSEDVVASQLLLPGALTGARHEEVVGRQMPSVRVTLGSRVVYVLDRGPLPFGTQGVVVGIHPANGLLEDSPISWTVDVVTATRSLGGSSLAGRCSATRGVSVPASSLWNISDDRDFPETDATADVSGLSKQEVLDLVQEQVEFYLSDRNLKTDHYFLGLVQRHPEGLVPIASILSCNRIKEWTADGAVICEACRRSDSLLVSDDMTGIRRKKPLPPPRESRGRGRGRGRGGNRGKKRGSDANGDKAAQVLDKGEWAKSSTPANRPRKVQFAESVQWSSPLADPAGKEGGVAWPGRHTMALAGAIAIARLARTTSYRHNLVCALSVWPACGLLGLAMRSGQTADEPVLRSSLRPAPAVTGAGISLSAAIGAASGLAVARVAARSDRPALPTQLPEVAERAVGAVEELVLGALAEHRSQVVLALSLWPLSCLAGRICAWAR